MYNQIGYYPFIISIYRKIKIKLKKNLIIEFLLIINLNIK